MPKKKPTEKVIETRTMSKRAASKEALKQMQKLTAQAEYESPETLEITSDEEEVVTVDVSPKKKYRLSHRKSSDGNDRDVLVLKSIGWGEETLKLDAWVEDLSPAQLNVRTQCTKDIDDLNNRISKLLKETSSEVIFEGENTALYELEKEILEKTPPPVVPATNTVLQTSKSSNNQSGFQLVMDPRSGVVVGTMTPAVTPTAAVVTKPQTRKRTRAASNLTAVATPPPSKISKPNQPPPVVTPAPTPPPTPAPSAPPVQPRPTEATAVGGISHGTSQKSAPVVDLTSDDGRSLADSREISFNKLQGKTFPSLVVVARPHLRIKDSNGAERTKLDAKVKTVLMHPPTKFTEWLIQQGLIRSEQVCISHPNSKLKLGMYSDVSKFPFSGGYVWISECCPQRFVSVFSGSLFEGSPHPPSVILKLIYHWACQTNVQNVIQWVKVDNLYVKSLNTWLRAACTVALHTHVGPLGGLGKKVEVGVISLGTTSQDGHQRQVKVEVLGLLETEAKLIRLRAVEPLADGDRNYKKRFSKILEPLMHWVHPESTIITDLTVDKATLHSMGFKHVTQTTSNDGISNHTVMEYLRRIVPRMFQNTLSLLSRQIIQQFLDELVWREWFGTSAAATFDNIVLHLADQTRVDTGHSLITRLNKVSSNPFKNWSIKQYLITQSNKPSTETVSQKRISKSRKIAPKPPSPTQEVIRPSKPVSPDIPEQMVPLEHYYYGTIDGMRKSDDKSILNLKCGICKTHFTNNIKLMTHLFTHAHNVFGSVHQCYYCLATVTSKEILDKHIFSSHPIDTRCGDNFVCIICEGRFYNTYSLGKHMSREHVPSELPYQCTTCNFRCSSHRQAVDHFYASHDGAGLLQCPFCLKTTCISSNGRMVPQNLNYYLQHLQKHQKKSFPKKCSKCALWFVQKEILKDHGLKMHVTQRRKAGLVPWPVPRQSIMVPKSRQEEPVEEEEVDISNVVLNISDKLKCKECFYNLTIKDHFPALLFCANNNCQYSTCCKHAMNKHTGECKIFHSTLPVQRLPFKMYCVCGFNDFDGNIMAKHLAACERKSAYPSEKSAKAATVTHSMLDVLGLVRRPEEPVLTANEIMEIDSDDDKNGNTEKSKDILVKKDETNSEPMEISEETIKNNKSPKLCDIHTSESPESNETTVNDSPLESTTGKEIAENLDNTTIEETQIDSGDMSVNDTNLDKDDVNSEKDDVNLEKGEENLEKDEENLEKNNDNFDKGDTNLDNDDANLDNDDANLNKDITNLDKDDKNLDKDDANLDEADANLDEADANLDEADANVDEADANLDEENKSEKENVTKIDDKSDTSKDNDLVDDSSNSKDERVDDDADSADDNNVEEISDNSTNTQIQVTRIDDDSSNDVADTTQEDTTSEDKASNEDSLENSIDVHNDASKNDSLNDNPSEQMEIDNGEPVKQVIGDEDKENELETLVQ